METQTFSADTRARIQEAIQKRLPGAIDARHHLHQNPEISGSEEQTAAFVAQKLREIGFTDITTGVAGHGVVARLEGAKPGPVLALRADMDALPIQEQGALPYKSCVGGIMHACGHDGHTAVLLGTAAALFDLKAEIPATIKLIFQPAEETIDGADAVVAAGAIDDVAAIVALHGWPLMEIGQVGILAGPIMASADGFDITIVGKSGHAAYPHNTIDPIVIGAQVVQALQTLVSRDIAPTEALVVSVTQFHAGTAYNIIPDTAELKGTVRTLNKDVRANIAAKIERIIAGVCQAHGATYTFNYTPGTPVTVNDPGVTALVERIGRDVLGPDKILQLEGPTMGAEDFAYYLEHIPGMMFRLGVGRDVTPLHTPTYNFSDAAIPYGMTMFVATALAFGDSAPE